MVAGMRSMLGKALDILGTFTPETPELTQAQITRLSGVPHSTTRRILAELVADGFLEKTEDGNYTVGLRIWELGALSPRALPLRETAMPFMTVLNQSLGQHVQLAVREGDEAVVVERLSARSAIGVVSQVGGRLPLHSSGVGKALLAYAAPEEVGRLVSQRLPRLTPHTIVDPAILRRELGRVRQRGYAIVRDETSMGAASVAVPVRARYQGVVAAVSVVVPSEFIGLESLAPGVAATAKAISEALVHGVIA